MEHNPVNVVSNIRKFIQLCIVIALLAVLLGKLFFTQHADSLFLFIYGVTVTFVVWIIFFVAFVYYKDPYDLVTVKPRSNYRKKKSLVSCMVAVKNEEAHIGRCVDSMLRQSYNNKEIIVVDDASTDKTLQILQEYEKRGEIILIHLEQNLGKKRALARAMAVASGEIFAHTDSDSVWATDAIEKIAYIFYHQI